jgi:amidase
MDIALLPATELLDRLRDGELGSLELLDAQLARIERHDGDLNAVVAMDVEGARRAARAADDAPAGDRGPLHGLPITIKDSWEVAGMPATCGFPHLADHVPARDAEAVALLRAAGAIPFGKTNVPFAASDHQSYNPVYGTTSNPWDLARTPGGSSGGPAAAVAAGFTALELGSDIAGSIRIPAHFCGIFGHKPSYGIVPRRGHVTPTPGTLTQGPLSVGGPMARTAADLELMLDVIAAPAEKDRHAWSVRVPPSRHERLEDFRVALWADDEHFSLDSRCRDAIHAYADDLRRLGVQVDVARPDIDVLASDDLYVATLFSLITAQMPEELLAQFVEIGERDPDPRGYPARVAKAVRLTAHEHWALVEQQLQIQAAWARFFEGYDVVMCPIQPAVAFEHDHSGDGPGHTAQYERLTMVDGEPVPYLHAMQWTGLITIADLPATAIPTGRLVDGMPVGFQAVGPRLEDRTPLRFAQLAERELGGFVEPRALAARSA